MALDSDDSRPTLKTEPLPPAVLVTRNKTRVVESTQYPVMLAVEALNKTGVVTDVALLPKGWDRSELAASLGVRLPTTIPESPLHELTKTINTHDSNGPICNFFFFSFGSLCVACDGCRCFIFS